jgi:hypothetical protein
MERRQVLRDGQPVFTTRRPGPRDAVLDDDPMTRMVASCRRDDLRRSQTAMTYLLDQIEFCYTGTYIVGARVTTR